jgi:DNA replication licensing factor MCM6
MVDAVMQSDNAPASSDTAAAGRQPQARSSSRPRGPPSVSTPGMQSDVGGFADDEVVGARGMRRQLAAQDIPRVVDTTAETLGLQFERFLEKYAQKHASGGQKY